MTRARTNSGVVAAGSSTPTEKPLPLMSGSRPPARTATSANRAASAVYAHLEPVPEQALAKGVGCIDGNQRAAEHPDARRNPLGLVEVVRRDDDRVATGAEFRDELAYQPCGLRVEPRGRFVQENRRAGSWINARAIATFCFMPFESCAANVSRRSPRPNRSSARETARSGFSTPYRRAYTRRLSRTDKRSQRPGASVRKPTRVRTSSSRSRVSGMRAMLARPPDGTISPPSIRSVVVLPAPFGPSRPKISPGSTRSDTPSTATRSSKRRDEILGFDHVRDRVRYRHRERAGAGGQAQWSRSPFVPASASQRELCGQRNGHASGHGEQGIHAGDVLQGHRRDDRYEQQHRQERVERRERRHHGRHHDGQRHSDNATSHCRSTRSQQNLRVGRGGSQEPTIQVLRQ